MSARDGHVRVLPVLVANKIAAGEVVERPASVVKELVENSIDAGARSIRIAISQGGRKLVSVQDDGCGMTRDDAVLALERQATSKILDVTDIESIDTLGFRGEAIPSIASVSRFTLTTRRHDVDEGTSIQVNAGILAGINAAGCPPGTLVEVRDLFCNVPARRKFLRAYVTEESHVKDIFTVHALAHPSIAFSLTIDGRELYRLAPSANTVDRLRDLFGSDFIENMLPLSGACNNVKVSGFIERPNLAMPSRRDQYVFVNGRPSSAPSIAYAIREAYPRRAGDTKPAAVIFIELPPNQVDVNVHPTKREVRFRDNASIRQAITNAIEMAIGVRSTALPSPPAPMPSPAPSVQFIPPSPPAKRPEPTAQPTIVHPPISQSEPPPRPLPIPEPQPIPMGIEFAVDPNSTSSKPWKWFKFLSQTDSGFILIETDSGVAFINPIAARERIIYEQMRDAYQEKVAAISQTLLIPETVHLPPVDAARINASLNEIRSMGFQIEEFGRDTFKIDALPQSLGETSPVALLSTIARDLGEGGTRRSGDRWRQELIAKSIARSFAGALSKLTPEGATKLIEELCACRMPYVCPRNKPVLFFLSTSDLKRKLDLT